MPSGSTPITSRRRCSSGSDALVVGSLGAASPIEAVELQFGRLPAVESERSPQPGGLPVPGLDHLQGARRAQAPLHGIFGRERFSEQVEHRQREAFGNGQRVHVTRQQFANAILLVSSHFGFFPQYRQTTGPAASSHSLATVKFVYGRKEERVGVRHAGRARSHAEIDAHRVEVVVQVHQKTTFLSKLEQRSARGGDDLHRMAIRAFHPVE